MPKLKNNHANRLKKLVNSLQEEAPRSFDGESLESFRKMLAKPSNKKNDYNIELNSNKDTILHIAARSNITNKGDIDFLVDQVGLDPNKRAESQHSPLDSAIESFGANVVTADATGRDAKKVDSSVMEAVLEKSSLEIIRQPSFEQSTAFHMLNDIREANEGIYKTFADRLKGVDTKEKVGILNSKDINGETIFERLLLQKKFESFDKIYDTLNSNEQLEAMTRGISQRAVQVCDNDELEFFSERFNKVSSQKISQPTKVDFKKGEADALADMLASSIYLNKDNPSYGSDEKVKRLANELKDTGSLQDGVNQNLGENNSGDSLINLAIVMRDKRSFKALTKQGADFNDESRQRLPIKAAIDMYDSTTYSAEEDTAKQILEETIKQSNYKSILFAERENKSKPITFAQGISLIMPVSVGTATSLQLLASGTQGKAVPELAGAILDRAFELQPESIANFVSMRDSSGNTAVHSFAAKGNRNALLRVFNQEGISPEQKKQILELKNQQGRTPIDEASKNPETQKYLQKAYEKAEKDVNKAAEINTVREEEPKKKKGKNSKKKSKNNAVNESKKEDSGLELKAQSEPDLEDFVAQVYSVLKSAPRGEFPKNEFDSLRKNINDYILEKEGGNFKVLDDTLNEDYNYDTSDSYRDKINKALKKFPDDKKAKKAQAWVDGTGGRPDPSLKKDSKSDASKNLESAIEEDSVLSKTQSQVLSEGSKKDLSKQSLPKESKTDVSEISQDDNINLGKKSLEQKSFSKAEGKQDAVDRMDEESNTSVRPLSPKSEDVTISSKDGVSRSLKETEEDKASAKILIEEVVLQRKSKDSISTLTFQQDKDSQQELKMSENSAFKPIDKNSNSTINEAEKGSGLFVTANENESIDSSRAASIELNQYNSTNNVSIQPEVNASNVFQNTSIQQYQMQYPVDAYGQMPMAGYNEGNEYGQQGFMQQQAFAQGYVADGYYQMQMPQQFMPPAQMFDPYNQAAAMGYNPYGDPYMQYGQAPYMQQGYVDMPVSAYNQPPSQSSQSQTGLRGKDIESLKADETSLLKAAEAIRNERERLEGEEKKSHASSHSGSKSSSIKQIVKEGKKSPVQYVQQVEKERSAA